MIPQNIDELTEWVIMNKDEYAALALHPFVAVEMQRRLERLMFKKNRTKLVFSKASYTPASVLDRLLNESESISDQLVLRLAKHPNTAAPTLEQIYNLYDLEDVKESLAAHKNTPQSILECLDWKRSEKIRMALCNNSMTPLSLLIEMFSCLSLKEKKCLAKNSQLDHQILKKLWNDKDKYLRAEVVAHKNCPTELFDLAIESADVIIRKKLATNPSINPYYQSRLLTDKDSQVRAALINNHDLAVKDFTKEQLIELCNDPSDQVRRNSARRTDLKKVTINQLSRDHDPWVRRWLARNRQTPQDVLQSLAKDEDEHIRRAVARNPSCEKQTIEFLARDPSTWVRAGVAMRCDISTHCLLTLAKEKNIDVISAIGKNPKTPAEVLMEIAKSDEKDVRRAVIINQAASSEVLEKLQSDPYPLNRIILAGRTECNKKTRWGLMKDPHNEVRFNAVRTYVKQIQI